MRRLLPTLWFLVGCAHHPVSAVYDVRCYSGGQLILRIPRAREPWAGPSGTWTVRSVDGTVLADLRADCEAERVSP